MPKPQLQSTALLDPPPVHGPRASRSPASAPPAPSIPSFWGRIHALGDRIPALLKPLNLTALIVLLLSVGPSIKTGAEILRFPPDWKAAAQFLIPAVAVAAWSFGRAWVAYHHGRCIDQAERRSRNRSARAKLDPAATETAATAAIARAESRPCAALLLVPFFAIALSVVSFVVYLCLHNTLVVKNEEGTLFVLPLTYHPETLHEIKARNGGLAYVLDNDTLWLTDQLKTVEAFHVAQSNAALLLTGLLSVSSLTFGTTVLSGARKSPVKAADAASALAKVLQ